MAKPPGDDTPLGGFVFQQFPFSERQYDWPDH
jgi:hypothetical protein